MMPSRAASLSRRIAGLAIASMLAPLACSRDRAASPSEAPALVRARPYAVHVPARHDARAPLVVALHGLGQSGGEISDALHLTELSDAHGFVVAMPDGTKNKAGARFWNASDACCDFFDQGVDDVAYLSAVIDDAVLRHPVDPERVYLIGFSNGGFLAHRYACDHPDRVAAVVSLAGAGYKDPAKCTPKAPVTVLEVHGDADNVVRYAGGRLFDYPTFKRPEVEHMAPFPGARETVEAWAKRDGCTGAPTKKGDPYQEETRFGTCTGGAEVDLWTIHGAGHALTLDMAQMEHVWSFLKRFPSR